MSDKTFHQFAHELVNEEVNVVTTQGNFEGRLLLVGSDIIVLQNRMAARRRIIIRILEIVALFRAEIRPTGPFGFMGAAPELEESHESRDHEHN
ncbi:DUF2642 domain-containing protein [Neobacillus rhizophilus]|uniref:DUF2642 domain-containing protein n=1 Tax=Neobacillus rhizophilus TaxID=2833579 RepID=A0A942U523_9BACI|nr:DUF2642 domain-containing protein [Neobacillus rhizophilus]MBS4211179.1 DUF2642 domain-containing protein [Neobacillus rhizophilus]